MTSTSLGTAGLAVTTDASSSCDTGDVLSANQVAITTGSQLIASGVFDFSSTPIGIPYSGRRSGSVTFVFPSGSFHVLPDAIAALGANALTASVDPVGTSSVTEMSHTGRKPNCPSPSGRASRSGS